MFALASMLLAAGCSQEEEPIVNTGNEYVEASFTVDLGKDVQSRGLGEADLVNKLYYGIFDQNGNAIPVIADLTQVENYTNDFVGEAVVTNRQATVKMQLVKGQQYDFVFWAQVDGQNHYTIGETLKEITVNYNGDANDETRDAFFACEPDYTVVSHFTKTVTLKRPFAQVNVGTTVADYEAAKILLGGYPVSQSQLVVKNIPSTLNLLTGAVSNPTATATFKMANFPDDKDATTGTENYDLLRVQGTNYVYLGMNYLLADVKGEQEVKDVTLSFANSAGKVINTFDITQLPVYRNYRTNIIGNILTTSGEFNIVIDEEFEKDDNIHNLYDGTVQKPTYDDATKTWKINSPQELAWIAGAVNGTLPEDSRAVSEPMTFEGETVKLEADINLNNVNWTPIGHCEPVNKAHYAVNFRGTFDGNGHIISNLNVTNNYRAGLFGQMVKGTIKNVTLKNVTLNTHHYAGAILAWGEEGNDDIVIENCHVDGGAITVTPELIDGVYDNGDKAGGIVGFLYHGAVINSSAKNLTLSAYRDLGGIVGHIEGATISGNNVDDIDLVCDQTLYAPYAGTPKAANVGNVVGRQAGTNIIENNEEGADVTTSINTVNDVTSAASQDELAAALSSAEENTIIALAAGTYTFPAGDIKPGVVINCEEGTVFEGNSKGNINGATIVGATFSNPSGTAMDQTINGTFKNCTFEGKNGLRWAYAGETAVFENCVFSGSTYGAHFDGGANDLIFKNCTFSGFNTFGGAIAQLTLENCTFKSNGKSNYNGVNLWGNTKLIGCEFTFDGSVDYEWVDIVNIGTFCEFQSCTVNGQPLKKNTVGVYPENGYSTLKVNEDSYIYVNGQTSLKDAVEDLNDVTLLLTDGTYEGEVDLTGKKLNIEAVNKDMAIINGLVWADNCTVTLKGLKLTNENGVQHPNPINSKYYSTINSQYPLIGAYNNAAITVEECTLDLTGPTVYGFYGYAHNTPVFKNSTFNCNKIRPIANNGDAITVTGCTFNNQYHYSVRIFENGEERQTVVFTDNIIQGSNDKGEFEGINISEKGGSAEDKAVILGDFTIKGNTAGLKYRHNIDAVMSAECTYNTDIRNFAFEAETE